MDLVLGGAVASNVLALVQVALAIRVVQKVPPLSSLTDPMPAEWPLVSIVVPARNEGGGIEAALRSKLDCGYPNVEVIVVDDRSTDDTGAIAERLAAADSRVVVVHVDALPDGWLGKVHAMSVGVERARGEFVLLSDADVHVAPGTLQRVVAYAEAGALDLVAAMPRMNPAGLVLDACVAGMLRLLSMAGRTWSANADDSSVGVGVGAFNLVRRSALQKSPGLRHLRMEMADDVALGAMLKASGARCRFVAGREAVHLVFAERLGVLASGMEKGGGMFGFSLIKTALVAAVWLAIDFAVPALGLVAGGSLAWWGALQWASLTVVHLVVTRHFRGPMLGALLWPLGVLLGIAMLVRSGVLAWARGAIVWRGTRYSKADIEAGRRFVNGRIVLDSRPSPACE